MSQTIRILLACLTLFSSACLAHEASSSYLYWQDNKPTQLRLDIALGDLLANTALSADAAKKLRWQTLLNAERELADQIETDVRVLDGNTTCKSKATLTGLTDYDDTVFSVWQLEWNCPATHIDYQLFARDDALHRALVTTQREDTNQQKDTTQPENTQQLSVLSPSNPQLDLTRAAPLTAILGQFLYQGMIHMWLGLDHVLFLLTLLMLVFIPGRDQPAPNHHLKQLILVTSSFTIAHSITLVLSSLSLISVSSRVVETLIALSIVVSALKVLWPHAAIKTVAISFGFGLLHGLGFAGVLADLIAQTPSKLVALLGFNVGIEVAQLIIMIGAYPLLKLLRKHPELHSALFKSAAVLIALCGAVWAAQRSGLV